MRYIQNVSFPIPQTIYYMSNNLARFWQVFGKIPKRSFKNKQWSVAICYIREKLELSVDLRLKTSRDCYATTLKRAGVPTIYIGETHSFSHNSLSHSLLANSNFVRQRTLQGK
jgi:ubiquinone biosynthesis protein COQ9